MPPKRAALVQMSRKRTRDSPEPLSSSAKVGSKRRKLNGAPEAKTPILSTSKTKSSIQKRDVYEIPTSSDDDLQRNGPEPALAVPPKNLKKTTIPSGKSQRGFKARDKKEEQGCQLTGSTSKPSARKNDASKPVGSRKELSRIQVKVNDEDNSEVEEVVRQHLPSKGRRSTRKDKPSTKKLMPVDGVRKGRSSLAPTDGPKSILTPTKNRTGLTSKKVVFSDDATVEFKLDTLSGKSCKQNFPRVDAKSPGREKTIAKPKSNTSSENDDDSDDDDDDEPCAICGKPETTLKNDILFCDKCDIAVHQDCYGVPLVPEGDWFCHDCSGKQPELKQTKAKLRENQKKQPSSKPTGKVAQQPILAERHYENGDQDDLDVPCAICGNPDTEEDDDIIFCDNCEYAVHQKCYNVLEIPEGDWLCRKCAKKEPVQEEPESVEVDEGPSDALALASAIPKIPNFEQHLRAFQRVLLDRCTGQRRIKLRGQDEVYRKARNLVEQTVLAGEGNSMLIIGARGCGKTTVSSL